MALPGIRQLAVFSHVVHYRHEGGLYAYTPYARELLLWGQLCQRLTVVSPKGHGPPPADTARIELTNIELRPLPEIGGATWMQRILRTPQTLWAALRILQFGAGADAVHVRCPGNIGVLAATLLPLVNRRRIAKYAGSWAPYAGEARTYARQRAILRSRWWGAPVTVYGEWPGQPAHIIPFFTSVLTQSQLPAPTSRTGGHRLLFVGRLSQNKNVAALLRACAALGGDWSLTLVGDGEQRSALTQLAVKLGIADRVAFAGPLPFDDVLAHYRQHDILVLPSDTEGWPKAIVEGMALGLACIGSNRGLVPWLLGDGRGLVTPPGDPAALQCALQNLLDYPQQQIAISARAQPFAQQFTLEALQLQLETLCRTTWAS